MKGSLFEELIAGGDNQTLVKALTIVKDCSTKTQTQQENNGLVFEQSCSSQYCWKSKPYIS